VPAIVVSPRVVRARNVLTVRYTNLDPGGNDALRLYQLATDRYIPLLAYGRTVDEQPINGSSGSLALAAPSTPGDYQIRIVFAGGHSATPRVIASSDTFRVVAAPPSLVLDTTFSTFHFGRYTVGTHSAPRLFQVTNQSDVAVTLGLLDQSGSVEFPIARDGCSGAHLGPGQTCAVSIVFVPVTTGQEMATLKLTASAPHAASETVRATLYGTGAQPRVAALATNPDAISFGRHVVGSASAVRRVTITNLLAERLTLVAPVAVGSAGAPRVANASFLVVNATSTCRDAELRGRSSSGDRCVVDVRFQPRAEGVTSALLAITGRTAAGREYSRYVVLTGEGTPAPHESPRTTLHATPSPVHAGSKVTVSWRDVIPTSDDRISLYKDGAPDSRRLPFHLYGSRNDVTYHRINGRAGEFSIVAPTTPGRYVFRLSANGTRSASSEGFTVNR